MGAEDLVELLHFDDWNVMDVDLDSPVEDADVAN